MTKAQKKYTDQVIAHGCLVCSEHLGVFSPAEVHHVRRLATSKKRDRAPIIPVCSIHHRTGGRGVAIDAGRESWEQAFGSELEMAQQIINLHGPMP
jgi:hypothetical protein